MNLTELITRLKASKASISSAIRSKGGTVSGGFESFASDIQNIPSGGVDTDDATATMADIRYPKTAYVKGVKVTGGITDKAAQVYTPSTSNQIIASGQYLAGAQTIKGDANLIEDNIKDGVAIFGVTGRHKGGSTIAVEPLSVSSNGTYTAPDGKGYSPVTVNVSGGGSSDRNVVVSVDAVLIPVFFAPDINIDITQRNNINVAVSATLK